MERHLWYKLNATWPLCSYLTPYLVKLTSYKWKCSGLIIPKSSTKVYSNMESLRMKSCLTVNSLTIKIPSCFDFPKYSHQNRAQSYRSFTSTFVSWGGHKNGGHRPPTTWTKTDQLLWSEIHYYILRTNGYRLPWSQRLKAPSWLTVIIRAERDGGMIAKVQFHSIYALELRKWLLSGPL